MRRAEMDGVTVFQHDLPGVLGASLTFGCGTRDEELDSIGLNHLVHHLLERADPYIAEKYANDTWVNETSFVAAGTPAQIAEHFTTVCSAISHLPPTDLSDAVADVDADDRDVSDIDEGVLDPWGSLLARRFGPRGHGLARWPAVDYRLFTADEVSQHVGRFFTSGNAVLATTAEAPAAMRLLLPAGPRAHHDIHLVNHQSGPAWYADEVRGVALVVGAAPSVEALLLMSALRSRVDQALQRAGIAPFAELMAEVVDGTRHELGIRISPTRARRFDAAAAAELLWAELRRLVHDGLDPADMADLEATRTAAAPAELVPLYDALAWMRPIGKLGSAVHRELFGTTEHYLTDPLTEPDGLSPAATRDIMSGWLSSAMIVVPYESRPDLPGVGDASCPSTRFVPAGEVVRPALRKRFGNKGSMVIGTDAISTVDGEGNVHTVPLAQALVVEGDDALWLAHVGHGCVTTISDFTHAADKLRSALPPRRFRRAAVT
ncbi:hypothetical protein [Micromonospora sp. WMMD1155]|uniref:hypothetical protein n=1 Tax=Micromonospora sp. WMMD1155 TaxID=3016094 RepID=UPI00249C0860|nr:hypothetical protein [Micromonospora sp. WMMD1155]WFE51888.1 hypothetical protein O7617_16830 [Micromonospora sp. WMMD1155]